MRLLHNYMAKEKIEKNSNGKNFHVSHKVVSIMDDTHQICQIEVKIVDNSRLLTRFLTKSWWI